MTTETAPAIGHNGIAADELSRYVARIERLQEDKAVIGEDMKQVYLEAKATGFDTKIMRQIIRDRHLDAETLREREEMLDLYRHALGMLADTPLGSAALAAAGAQA